MAFVMNRVLSRARIFSASLRPQVLPTALPAAPAPACPAAGPAAPRALACHPACRPSPPVRLQPAGARRLSLVLQTPHGVG